MSRATLNITSSAWPGLLEKFLKPSLSNVTLSLKNRCLSSPENLALSLKLFPKNLFPLKILPVNLKALILSFFNRKLNISKNGSVKFFSYFVI